MNKEKMEIRVLGGLELKYKDKVVGVNASGGKSRKMWAMFEYILLNRDRKVPQEELIEILWPEMDVVDPANSLKVLVFKLRKEIDSLGFLPGKEVVLSISGGYSINDEMEYTLDLEEFERYRKQTGDPGLDDDEVLDILLEALGCYKGNVLSDVHKEPWAVTLQTHYYELYRQLVNRAQRLLEKRKGYSEIVEICKDALLIDPHAEEYYYHIIKAYAALENYSAASLMYKKVKEVMQRAYGTMPDNKFEIAYKELMKERSKKNLSVEELSNNLIERTNFVATFYVEYGEFRQIYRLIARRLERFDTGAFLCAYTLGKQKAAAVSDKEKDKHLEILGEALAFALRQGDVFTRATPNQFAVIFNTIAVENIELVFSRVKRYFDRHKQSKAFGIIHSYAPIEPSSFEAKMEEQNRKNQ